MIWMGGERPWGSSHSGPCHGRGHLLVSQVAPSSLGSLLSAQTPSGEDPFPNIQPKLPLTQRQPFLSPVPAHREQKSEVEDPVWRILSLFCFANIKSQTDQDIGH